MLSSKLKSTVVWFQVALVMLLPFFVIDQVQAAGNLAIGVIRLDRMTQGVANNPILVIANPTTNAPTETGVRITFTGYTVNATSSNITATTTGVPTTYHGAAVTAWPGIGATATGVAGQTVTFASSNLTAGTQYGFYITAGITNPASVGQYEVTIETLAAGPTVIDQAQIGTRIIADDQIDISAVVPPTFSFTLSANADAFTTDLDPASVVSTTGVNVTVATNAAHGWVAWAKSSNGSLTSATSGVPINASGTINAAPNTLSAGTNGYVMDCDLVTDSGSGTGAVTIDPEYNGATTSAGGTPSTSYQPIASGNGTTAGDIIKLIERATISAVQPAATDYTDTLTVIGAGSF